MSIRISDPKVDELLQKWQDRNPVELRTMSPPFCYSEGSLLVDHYCPIVSTIFNIFIAINKFFQISSSWDGAILPSFQPLTRENRGYWRHAVVSVPVLGNIIIALYDRHAKTMAENLLKDIPKGTSLNDQHIVALKQAAGYGCMEAIVRLAQYYVWNGCPKGMDNVTYFRLVSNLYMEACKHGNPDAQEWEGKWGGIFTKLFHLKFYKDYSCPDDYQAGCSWAINIAEQWTNEMQAKLPVFEEISSFCLTNPTLQKLAILEKLCNKVGTSPRCDTSKVRAMMQSLEKEVSTAGAEEVGARISYPPSVQ